MHLIHLLHLSCTLLIMHHYICVEIEMSEQDVGEPEPEPVADYASFEPQGRHLSIS